jgi:hypothetical protein
MGVFYNNDGTVTANAANVVSFDAEKASRYIRQALMGFYADQPDSDYQRGFLAALLTVYGEGLGRQSDDMVLHLEGVI